MTPPRKAIILAAGYGTRMEPLSRTVPKCLLPFWNRPIIAHTLDTLAAWGVRDVLVNLHHAPQPVFDYLRTRAWEASPRGRATPSPAFFSAPSAPPRETASLRRSSLRISLSHEPEILGTGGALRRAAWFLDTEPFWMINGDIVFRCDPRPLQRAFDRPRTIAALMMTASSGPRTVELNPNRTVRNFRSTHAGAPGTLTFCGLQLLSPRILDFIPALEAESSIVSAYEAAARAGHRVTGVPATDFWADIGTPEGLLRAHVRTHAERMANLPGGRIVPDDSFHAPRRLKRRGILVAGFIALGRNVTVGKARLLHNVIAMDDAQITPGAEVDHAILAPRLVARGHIHRLAVPLPDCGDPVLADAVRRLGWPAADTVVQPLSPRGSARAFARLTCRNRRAIVIRYSLERPENARFAGHARFLASCGLRVPEILVDLPAARLVVTEDLGTRDLRCTGGRTPSTQLRTYRRVLTAVAHWHQVAGPTARRRLALEPAFGPKLFRWEHELFVTHYLVNRLNLAPQTFTPALRDLTAVARILAREPLTLVHRDLQSTNILFAGKTPAFIDFQGMRMGPAVYDLASLLADPYMLLPEPRQLALLDHYASLTGVRDPAGFRFIFWHAVVQRLVQAIGAYGRLSRLPGTRSFERHIPPALEMLDRACRHLYTLPKLRDFVAELRRIERSRSAA